MRICLVNMPFAYLRIPSIALTQLKSVIGKAFGKQVQTEMHYFNMDFSRILGPQNYDFMAENIFSGYCNFGEWFFRQEAFPHLEDNTKSYFDHYNLHFDQYFLPLLNKEKTRESIWPPLGKELIFYAEALMDKRSQLGAHLEKLVIDNGLHVADVVGFTSMFQQNVPSFAMARKIKELNPEVTIVMGGANCESPMGEEIVRNIEVVDYVFSGNALISFPQFIGHCLNGDHNKCHQINGVFSKKNLTKIHYHTSGGSSGGHNIQPLGEELNINEIVELDYDTFLDDLQIKLPNLGIKPVLLFETSRGCWWGAKAHCTFCGLNGGTMGYRAMDTDTAVEVLSRFFNRYGNRVKDFSSVDNIMPKEYLEAVFPKLDLPKDMTLFYEVKADLKPEQLKIMANAKIKSIQPGIESLNSGTLKLMKKGVTAVGNVNFLKNSSKYNIHSYWNFLIGFPGESEDAYPDYLKNLEALFHLTPPKAIYIVRFDRYSPYHMQAQQYGLDLEPMAYNRFLYPDFGNKSMMNMVYFFEDKNQDAAYKKLTRKWYYPLSDVISQWAKRYKVKDGKEPPRLYFEDDQTIYDSRSGVVVKHYLSPAQYQLLTYFNEPKNSGDVLHFLNNGARANENDLQYLVDRKLVFHEQRKRYVSLVFENTEVANVLENDFWRIG